MFTDTVCTCCSEKFSYIVRTTITKRKDNILSIYEFPKEISEKVDKVLNCICINCFIKYLEKPENLKFEIEVEIIK